MKEIIKSKVTGHDMTSVHLEGRKISIDVKIVSLVKLIDGLEGAEVTSSCHGDAERSPYINWVLYDEDENSQVDDLIAVIHGFKHEVDVEFNMSIMLKEGHSDMLFTLTFFGGQPQMLQFSRYAKKKLKKRVDIPKR